jgi:environmental stress-induced protein Ves
VARLIAFQDLSPVPWKNGGGSTTELAVFPAGAGFDGFDWRISLATIGQSGAFSAFPGIDRSLVLVDGEALSLDVGGAAVRLDGRQPLLSFAGETPVFATVAAATTDFNVMTRRSRCRHTLERLVMTKAPLTRRRGGAVTLVFLANGERAAVLDGVGRTWSLECRDALLLGEDDTGVFTVDAAEGTVVFIVELFID